MDTERSGLDEAMDVGSSTISHLKSLKTAATFSKAGYGAALGGPFSAAIGAVIANRNQFAKILLVILAILLLPVLFIVMLPGLIFGSLTDQSDVLNSNSMISENIRASRDAIVEVLEESHEDILAEIHAAISRLPQGDTACKALLATGNCHLVEGNNWGDYFWGSVNGHGENHLGRILMDIRAKLQFEC